MKKVTKGDSSSLFADPIFQDNVPRRTKMALVSFYKKEFPIYVEYVLLFIKYAQLISQIILQTHSLYYTRDLDSQSSLTLIRFFLKFINPGYFLDFDGDPRLSWGIAITAVCLMVFRSVFAIYIAWIVFRKSQVPHNFAHTIWVWLFKLQIPVTYFMFISIFSKLITIAQDGISVLASVCIALCIFFILLETCLSLALAVRYNYMLPQKTFTASKNSITEITVMSQKLLLLILQPFLHNNSLPSLIIAATINLLGCILMNYFFITTLPYFNTKALIFKQDLITLVSSLSLIFFIRSIVVCIDDAHFGIDSALIIWIFLAPLLIKALSARLKDKLLKIITQPPTSGSFNILMHKLILVQELIVTKRQLDNENKTIDKAYFFHKSVELKLTPLFDLYSEYGAQQNLTIQTNKQANKVFLAYLEGLQMRFPKNDSLKLYLAYYYGKKLKMYGVAIRLLTQLEQKGSYQATLSASILKREIQRKMTTDQTRKSKENIDCISYVTNAIIISRVKDMMLNQTELQIKLCNEYKRDIPDMAKILEFSQKIDTQRNIVEKKLKIALDTLPDYYLEPYILAQYYYGMVNHSIFDHLKFRTMLANKSHKYEKKFKGSKLEQENMYDANNVFLVISGQRENAGAIVYCSNSIEDVLGWSPKLLLETNLTTLAPTCLQSYCMDNIKSYIEESDSRAKEPVIRTFMLNKVGFMTQVDICFAIHPYMQEGFYLDVLIRPVPTTVDYLILTDDGKINAFTKKIGTKLGLLAHRSSGKGDIHAKSICEDLERANIAFNMLTNHVAGEAKGEGFPVSRTSQRSSNLDSPGSVSVAEKRGSKSRMSHFNFMKRTNVNHKENGIVDCMKIFNAFSSEGKVVKLNSLKHAHNANQETVDTSYSLPYHCHIENKIHGHSQIRLCTLIEVSAYDQPLLEQKTGEVNSATKLPPRSRDIYAKSNSSSSSDNDSESEANPRKVVKSKTEKTEKTEKNDKNDITSFHTEDEKQDGWVNFARVSINRSQLLDSPPAISVGDGDTVKVFNFGRTKDRLPSTRRTLLGDQLVSTARADLLNQSSTTQKRPSNIIIKPQKVKPETKTTEKKQFEDLLDIQKSLGSQKSNFSTRGRIFKACEKALETNHYPRKFDMLFIVMGVLLATAFISQIVLQVVADKRFTTLQGRRDVLRNAQIRNYMLIRTQELIRNLWDAGTINGSAIYTDPQDIEDADALGNYTIDTLQLSGDIQADLDSLVEANQGLLLATDSLTPVDRNRLFTPNVRVFETYFNVAVQTYFNLTNFQATDLLIDNLYTGLIQAKTNIKAAVPEFQFICRNSLNDFLVTSESAVDIFLNALYQMEAQDKNIQSALFAVGLLMVFSGFALVCATLLMKYSKERFCLLSFSRMEVVQVDKVHKRLVEFKKIITEELYYKKKDKSLRGSVIFDGLLKTKEDLQPSVKKHIREVNNKGIIKKYYAHAAKALSLVLVVAALYSMKYVLTDHCVDSTYSKLLQLEYSDSIRGRIYLSYTTLYELLSENDTVLIRNQNTSVQLVQQLADINGIRNNISSGEFANKGAAYDPVIEGLLFHDACSYLNGSLAEACTEIEADSSTLNFLSLLSDIEYYTTLSQTAYNVSAKRTLQLRKLQKDANTTIDPRIQTITELNELLSDRLNELFEDEVSHGRYLNSVQTTVLVLALVVMAVGGWYLVLRKIRESENDFKKLLKVFPADIILSNFLLKDYLKKTSKDAFNSVINEI